MNPALRTAATGMAAQQQKVESIAHNIANVNTTGFKRSQMSFEDLLYQQVEGQRIVSYPSSETLPAVQIGRGVRVVGNPKVFTQGSLEQTGRSLDLAIQGEGFFQVQRPDGTMAYTRDGSFNISDRGVLTTQGGYALMPEIQIPEDIQQLTISSSGIVSGVTSGSSEPLELGRVEVARFVNPAGLQAMGENLFVATPSSGSPIEGYADEDGMGRIAQGFLETSNVEIVNEMVQMIAAQRAYGLNSKSIQAADDMMQRASELGR